MKIIVLAKEVPDTYGDRKLDLETGLADRAASDVVLDEIAERSLEVALTYADKTADTEVVMLSMAPGSASASLRKGLTMGATSAVQVADEALRGADLGLTAEVLAAAVRRIGFDLVIAGNLSTDGTAGVLAAMLAENLGVPHATSLTSIEITADAVTGTRPEDSGTLQVKAPLPAVVSITEALPDARLPSFKGIKAAKKKPLELLSLSDLAVDPYDPGAGRSIIVAITEKPVREAGVKIVDEGDAGDKLAEFLLQNRFV
ncbi:electron transfer flavoprotein subunit beta/FixA family protein [Paenarthrobacter aurescens]|uniref:electron transfer flavoprotein subunit beta/FixA family protein n=1 Tax=Paenarthrobacter aurescens TaxID=43663 RepID=UPI0035ECF452